jgi:aryl-alcohol dehydrogenase-like predicted oxidoreductase
VLAGRATAIATRRFHDRHRDVVTADHVRALGDLSASSVGIGTYLGQATDDGDVRYEGAIARALELGVNVVDAAINYRNQRSERAVGRALSSAASRGIPRDEIIVATKGGFIPRGLVPPSDLEVVAGIHCMAPRWLDDQIARSRDNLEVETIDVYYLHNPETQLEEIDRPTFMARMRAAFETLERACADGRIARYGTATWDGYRVPHEAAAHLDLFELERLARDVAGDSHHFRVIQLPLNRRMTEATEATSQASGDRHVTVLEAAQELGIYVMSSASILQGKLAPDQAAARSSIDWVRARPGLGTALVGMGRVEHVDANCAVFRRR